MISLKNETPKAQDNIKIVAMPYGIDVDKVKAVFACKNHELFNKVMSTETFRLYNPKIKFKRELHNIFFKYVENNGPKSKRLFGFLNMRRKKNLKGKWLKYGFALQAICEHLGKDLSGNTDIFTYGEEWWKLNTILRRHGSKIDLSKMISPNRLFDTPFEKDKICSNFYSKEEIKQFSEQLEQIRPKVNKETEKLYSAVKNGLDYCVKKDCEWISFSYQKNNYCEN